MESYWDKRFINEGMIWGGEPSKTAYHALELFKANEMNSILVPGSGYGRNTKLFSTIFNVTGIELSKEAISMAMKWDTNSKFITGSVLDPVIRGRKYDAVYCYDVLHLFLKQDRKRLIENCVQQLRDSGFMFFTCFSDEDSNNGIGKKIEEGTYEYVEGKHAHFFSEKDLIDHFEGLELIEIGKTKEKLNYKDNRVKEYLIRYIVVKKI